MYNTHVRYVLFFSLSLDKRPRGGASVAATATATAVPGATVPVATAAINNEALC